VRLTVTAVAAEAAMPSPAAFVPLELLVATEDWRDGYAVDALGWTGQPQPDRPRTYARFRLYAASIYEVAALGSRIEAEGVEVRTKAAEIESVQLLDRNLDRVFWLIAGSAIVGFLASLAANLLANVERKRKELSILRLIGFSTASIIAFPIVQAALTAILGGVLAIGVAHGLGATLNRLFASSLRPGEEICRLLPAHVAASLGATLAAAVLASAWAGLRASRIEPAEGIRDV
jgi:putative ABC transport system permease protein